MSYITSVDGTLVIEMIGQLSHDIIGRWGLMVIGYKDCKGNKCVWSVFIVSQVFRFPVILSLSVLLRSFMNNSYVWCR